MKQYVEITAAAKLKLLNKHSMGKNWKSLGETRWCLHCESQFTGHSVRVYRDEDPELWLECGTPGCDGSPIDWADYPWWDENHPKTKAENKALNSLSYITESGNPEKN